MKKLPLRSRISRKRPAKPDNWVVKDVYGVYRFYEAFSADEALKQHAAEGTEVAHVFKYA